MSTPSAVPRTAPIAIAPKPPRFHPSRQGSINLDSYPGLRNGFDSPDSGSINGHPTHPCEACFRRRLDCVMSDDEEGCVRCVLSGAECSLLESPMPRKRKLNGFAEDSISKRRYVTKAHISLLPKPPWSTRTTLQAGLAAVPVLLGSLGGTRLLYSAVAAGWGEWESLTRYWSMQFTWEV